MSINDDILATLRDSSEPLSNRQIREALDLETAEDAQRISNALHSMLSRGQIERIKHEDQAGYFYRVPVAGSAPPPAAVKPQREPAPLAASTAAVAHAGKTQRRQKAAAAPKPKRQPRSTPPAEPAPAAPAAGADAARVAPIAGAPTLGHLRQQLRLVASEVLLEAGGEPMPDDLQQALHELIRLAA
jgi:hypothetical protein